MSQERYYVELQLAAKTGLRGEVDDKSSAIFGYDAAWRRSKFGQSFHWFSHQTKDESEFVERRSQDAQLFQWESEELPRRFQRKSEKQLERDLEQRLFVDKLDLGQSEKTRWQVGDAAF